MLACSFASLARPCLLCSRFSPARTWYRVTFDVDFPQTRKHAQRRHAAKNASVSNGSRPLIAAIHPRYHFSRTLRGKKAESQQPCTSAASPSPWRSAPPRPMPSREFLETCIDATSCAQSWRELVKSFERPPWTCRQWTTSSTLSKIGSELDDIFTQWVPP